MRYPVAVALAAALLLVGCERGMPVDPAEPASPVFSGRSGENERVVAFGEGRVLTVEPAPQGMFLFRGYKNGKLVYEALQDRKGSRGKVTLFRDGRPEETVAVGGPVASSPVGVSMSLTATCPVCDFERRAMNNAMGNLLIAQATAMTACYAAVGSGGAAGVACALAYAAYIAAAFDFDLARDAYWTCWELYCNS